MRAWYLPMWVSSDRPFSRRPRRASRRARRSRAAGRRPPRTARLEPDGLHPEIGRVRPPADRDEHLVADGRVVERDRRPARRHPRRAGFDRASEDVDAFRFERGAQRFAGERLLATERRSDALDDGHLARCRAAATPAPSPRRRRRLPAPGAVGHLLCRVTSRLSQVRMSRDRRSAGSRRRPGGKHDGRPALSRRVPSGRPTSTLRSPGDRPRPRTSVPCAPSSHLTWPSSSQLPTTASRRGERRVDVDLTGDRLARAGHPARRGEHRSRAQQRLARHACPVGALAPEQLRLDHGDREPALDAAPGDVLARRAAPDHDDVELIHARGRV